MESIFYERLWVHMEERFTTRCPYRRGLLVGSKACFFCKHCKGRTEDKVECAFETSISRNQSIGISMDVMVKGEFRRTIRVKPTGWKIIGGEIQVVLTEEDINKAVAERCPFVYGHEKWYVEFNND